MAEGSFSDVWWPKRMHVRPWRRLGLSLAGLSLAGLSLAGLLLGLLPVWQVKAHPGNVFAEFSPAQGSDSDGKPVVKLTIALTYENTGEPLLGARLWWVPATGEEATAGASSTGIPIAPAPGQEAASLPAVVTSLWGEQPGHGFLFAGAPHQRISQLPVPESVLTMLSHAASAPAIAQGGVTQHYWLRILSLGEVTEGQFEVQFKPVALAGQGEPNVAVMVSPQPLLLVFPDVGLPDYQLALIGLGVVVGMVLIIGGGKQDGSPPAPSEAPTA